MKIGVMGGSFNPIHIGHLNAASEVAEKVGLDKVFFVLSARPPHKSKGSLIDTERRYEMVKIACAEDNRFLPSRIEIDRPGKSYTIDTMRFFQKEYGKEVYFIVGQDALIDIATWKAASTLLKTCNFIAVTRPGFDNENFVDALQGVISVKYKNLVFREPTVQAEENGLASFGVAGSSAVIKMAPITPLDISSSMLRKRIANNETVRYLVPEGVWRYLENDATKKG